MGRGPPTSWPLQGVCSLSWWPRRKPVVGPQCPPGRDRLQGPRETSGAARFCLHARKSFNGVPSLRSTIRASKGGYHPGPRAQGPLNRSRPRAPPPLAGRLGRPCWCLRRPPPSDSRPGLRRGHRRWVGTEIVAAARALSPWAACFTVPSAPRAASVRQAGPCTWARASPRT